ncbi:MAG: 30S ribosomal protein S17 [Chloroflexi bacterium]|nr:30S ribosomal protein S17 [Chloroflexota bacterium]
MNQARQKTRIGRVVSDKMQKTVVVVVEWQRRHPLYHKAVRRFSRFSAHDEREECRLGDLVQIMETRPLSRTKRWRVVQVLQRREVPEVQPSEIGATVEQELVAIPSTPAEPSAAEAPAPAVTEGSVSPPGQPQAGPGEVAPEATPERQTPGDEGAR